MNFYQVGYTDWESSPITTICHVDKFTKEDFDEILLQAYVKANKELEASHNIWYNEWLEEQIQSDKELDIDYVEDMRYEPRVSEINSIALRILFDEYNFQSPNIVQSFIPVAYWDRTLWEMASDLDITPSNKKTKSTCEYVNMIRNRFFVVEKRNAKISKIIK